MSVTAKSVIIDCTDNYNDDLYMGIRQVDFLLDGALIGITPTDYTAYQTSSYFSYNADRAFDTSLVKDGNYTTGWQSNSYEVTNQRIICVLDSPIEFNEIRITNYHSSGESTTRGVKNAIITISPDIITSTVYNDSISNPTVIYDGIFTEHNSINEPDSEVLGLTIGPGGAVAGGSATITAEATQVLVISGNGGAVAGDFALINASYNVLPDYYLSVILDIADGWGNTQLRLRSVDFWRDNTKIEFSGADFTAYATTAAYSYSQPENVFDTSLLKIGAASDREWFSDNGTYTNQRLIVVFNVPQKVEQIRINNSCHYGADTDFGCKNVVISASPDVITDTTYSAAITNSTELFSGIFDEHIASDVEDEQLVYTAPIYFGAGGAVGSGSAVFAVTSIREDGTAYKSVVIDITDNWGDLSYVGLRSVEFWYGGRLVSLSPSDFTAYAPEYNTEHTGENVFNTNLSKVGSGVDNDWFYADDPYRIICVFDTATPIHRLKINNYHDSGGNTDVGARNVEIHGSLDSITDTTYEASIANARTIFSGELDKHVDSDVEDEQVITISEPIYIGFGGAVGGGAATTYASSVTYPSVGGAVAGGDALLDITLRVLITGIGGAVAGGSASTTIEYFFAGDIVQQLPEIVSSGVTEITSNGNIVASEVAITGTAESVAMSWGDIVQPPTKISVHMGINGGILQDTVTVAGTAITPILSYGRLSANAPSIKATVGSAGSIRQSPVTVSAEATTTILSNGDITQPATEIDGTLDIWTRMAGAIKSGAPTISATTSADDYAYGDIEVSAAEIDGSMYIWAVGNGNIEAPTSRINGKVSPPEESTIIRYRRGCPVV